MRPPQRVEEDEELQMKPLQRVEEDEELQMKPLQRVEEDEELQMKPLQRAVGLEGGDAGLEVEQAVEQSRGRGQALPDNVQAHMEEAFGADFSGVRIHTGAEADALNRSVSALAFTTGQDIYFRQGEYSPGTAAGRETLAHELTHVVQQGGAAQDVQRNGGGGSSTSTSTTPVMDWKNEPTVFRTKNTEPYIDPSTGNTYEDSTYTVTATGYTRHAPVNAAPQRKGQKVDFKAEGRHFCYLSGSDEKTVMSHDFGTPISVKEVKGGTVVIDIGGDIVNAQISPEEGFYPFDFNYDPKTGVITGEHTGHALYFPK